MPFNRNIPYNDLPLLPPKAVVESPNILKKVVTSSRALAELKGIGQSIPNQKILVDSILLQEARSSSEIENIITSSDALFKAFTAETNKIDPAIKEVLRYRQAIWEGYRKLEKRSLLITNLFISVYQTIKETQASIRNTSGTKIANTKTREIIYTPPEGENIIWNNILMNLIILTHLLKWQSFIINLKLFIPFQMVTVGREELSIYYIWFIKTC